MRKITSILMLLLMCVGASWAQLSIDEGYYYRIKNVKRSGYYMEVSGTNICVYAGNEGSPNQYWKIEEGTEENAGKYTICSADGKYMKYNPTKSQQWTVSDTKEYLTIANAPGVDVGEGNVVIGPQNLDPSEADDTDTYRVFAHDPNNGTSKLVSWGPKAESSRWIIEKTRIASTSKPVTVTYTFKYNDVERATQTFKLWVGDVYPDVNLGLLPLGLVASKPEGTIADDDNDGAVSVDINITMGTLPFVPAKDYASIEHWYYMNIRDDNSRTYLKYENGVDYIKAADNRAVVEAATGDAYNAYLWAFIGSDPYEGYKIVNRASGETYILSAPTAPTGDKKAAELARMVVEADATGNTNWMMKRPTHNNASAGAFYVEHPTATAYAFNRQGYDGNNGNNTLCYWSERDLGSGICVEEIDLSVDAAAKQAKADALALISASSVLFGDPATEGTLAYTAKTAIEAYTYDATSEEEVAAAVTFYNNTVSTMCAAVDKDIVFYNTNRNNQYMVVTDAVQLSGADAADGTSVFHVKGVEGTNRFTVQNKAGERYIANTPAASYRIQLSTTAGEFTIKSFGTDNMFAFISADPADATHKSLHLDAGFKVVAWEADTEGNASVWVIQEPASDLSVEEGTNIVKNQAWDPINTTKNNLSSVQIGNGLGQYNGDDATVTAFQTALNAIPASIDDLDFEAVYALNTEKDNLQTAYNALSINMPTAGFYRIKSMNANFENMRGKYVQNTGTEGHEVTASNGVNSVFYINDDNKILSFASGQYLNDYRTQAAVGEEGKVWTIEKNSSVVASYALKADGQNLWLSDWTNANKTTDGQKDGSAAWAIEPVEWLPIPMNTEVGYATLYSPVALGRFYNSQERVKVYTATVNDAKTAVELTECTEGVPANIGVILEYKAGVHTDGCVYLPLATTEITGKTSDMIGTFAATLVQEDGYVLSKPADKTIGLYKAEKNQQKDAANDSWKNNGFKAYLPASLVPNNAPALTFDFGTETGIGNIESTENAAGKAVIYDLSGRRVKSAQKGIFIINGKKVVK